MGGGARQAGRECAGGIEGEGHHAHSCIVPAGIVPAGRRLGLGGRAAAWPHGLEHALEDLVLGPEGLGAAVGHHQDAGRPPPARSGRWAITTQMPPALPHPEDRLGQGVLALGVEVGVGLVEHDEERIAVERAGQADALALPGRQPGAALAEPGVVALRQAQDQLVHARRPAPPRSPPRRAALADRTGRCSPPPCRRTARPPGAGSRVRPEIVGSTTGRGRPRRGGPCRAPRPHADQRAHQRATCPRREGPMTPSPWPACEPEARRPAPRGAGRRAARR